MAVWSAPRTWATGELVTPTMMNTHVRDEFLWLGGADGVLTAPPGTPTRYQRFVHQTGGAYVQHHVYIYRDDLNGTFPWLFLGGGDFAGGGSVSGIWSGWLALSGWVTLPRAGVYAGYASGHGDGVSQGAGSMLFQVGAAQVNDSFPGNHASDASVLVAQVTAGSTFGMYGNNTNVVSYSYSGQWTARPIMVA